MFFAWLLDCLIDYLVDYLVDYLNGVNRCKLYTFVDFHLQRK
jgi:hypothetical protein